VSRRQQTSPSKVVRLYSRIHLWVPSRKREGNSDAMARNMPGWIKVSSWGVIIVLIGLYREVDEDSLVYMIGVKVIISISNTWSNDIFWLDWRTFTKAYHWIRIVFPFFQRECAPMISYQCPSGLLMWNPYHSFRTMTVSKLHPVSRNFKMAIWLACACALYSLYLSSAIELVMGVAQTRCRSNAMVETKYFIVNNKLLESSGGNISNH